MTLCRFPDKLMYLVNADICNICEALIQKGLQVAVSAAKVEDREPAQIVHPCQDLKAPDLTFCAFPSQRLYRAAGISSNPMPVKVDDGGFVNEVHRDGCRASSAIWRCFPIVHSVHQVITIIPASTTGQNKTLGIRLSL